VNARIHPPALESSSPDFLNKIVLVPPLLLEAFEDDCAEDDDDAEDVATGDSAPEF